MLVRVDEFWHDHDPETTHKFWVDLNKMTGYTQGLSEKDRQRHPSMHRTNTLDVTTVLRGEVYLLRDEAEILLKPTDTVIIQGPNHGWRNRSPQPAQAVAVVA